MNTEEVKISTDFIKLDQLLKFAGAAESGGMAKDMILAGEVSVNGEPCTMRGKKIRVGDRIDISSSEVTLSLTIA